MTGRLSTCAPPIGRLGADELDLAARAITAHAHPCPLARWGRKMLRRYDLPCTP